MGYIYDNYIKSDKYVSSRGDGGTELFAEILEHIEQLEDEEILNAIYEEVETWLKVGAPSYFIMALIIVGERKLHQFKDLILERKETILRGRDPDMSTLPYDITIWIDNALEELDK